MAATPAPAVGEAPTGAPTVITLDQPPSLAPVYARAAADALPVIGGRDPKGGLPDTVVELPDAHVDADHLAAYAEVCGYRLSSTLPPTYLHMLGFPLSVLLMTRPDFPFGLMGMVHIRNTIVQHRPVGLDEPLLVRARVANLRPHDKGQQLDNVVSVSVEGEPVWESTSTYLKRGGGGRSADGSAATSQPRGADLVDASAVPLTARWRVPGDIGRRYATVSGDRNPIHLYGLTARAFGFSSAIAHGMWTKARALAGLEGSLPLAFEVDVTFKLPLGVPRTVEYATERLPDGWALAVRSPDGRPHLAGRITDR